MLPALVRTLTPSALMIGIAEAIRSGAWLIPQLLVAWSLSGRAINRRRMIVPFGVSRLSLALIAPLVLLAGRQRPALALAGLFVLFTVFYVADAFGALPYFDFFTVSLSPLNRSRLIGTAQALAGAGGIGCSFFVAGILAGPVPALPTSYSILFAAAGGFMALEIVVISFLRVAPGDHGRKRIPLRTFLPWLARLLARDRDFRRLILVRLLVGASGLSMPFYIVFGFDILHLGPQSVGVFTGAQVVGGIASAPLMAFLSEKRGTRSVIRLVAILSLLLPILGLCLFLLKGVLGTTVLLGLSATIFFLLGGVNNGNMAGFNNYLLEHAPPVQRAVYVGLANTLNGLVLVAPVIGGWILSATSYPVLFAVTAAVSLAGLLGTTRLSPPAPHSAQAA